MSPSPIKVLIVDDQPSVQNLIRHALTEDREIEVVGVAGDAYQARDLIKQLNPDVLTLDIEMPRMSGIDFLERLMRLRPMPVIMFSSLTQHGSELAVRALSLGAVDVLPKPLEGFTKEILQKLTSSVKTAQRGHRAKGSGAVGPVVRGTPEIVDMARWNGKVVLMGASTGGVAAVEAVLTRMPRDCPPIVISQHMPETFLKSFAGRLNDLLPQNVQLGRDGEQLKQGNIYLSPGGLAHTGVRRNGRHFEVTAIDAPKRNGHIPSVDELFYSAVDISEAITAVLLTGIGKDGAEGMRELKRRGAYCIGQDEASCVVYGMPRAAADMGILDQQLPLQEIAKAICASCETRRA
ncbi:chemotaxis response regulator protein-glutamate methylesterase [Pseudooceanicola sediminis]|uniref:Protein-glutamate methylesterase/protein-glutamine glutaminase n=1 Tax=Pseudooceanicola sediminis TaxID=2211117 RepID=A0A399JCZ2_9RHOB|nr:chemotaxis response regulator protein-glutamate methylesterase [Pseudooceanicola sediminis]KAA2317145.1 chemotaxis response regulator protein-glutamate methylesterase [Puniceibacterium sp. HSS470]RII40506.1 chemotaxis response regulator protein-glutamate methylesterase [Pseudooceanicola sediminis]|tara:strand:+ start:105936 stop:106985 length:1050 start_codon:yes stop_codon:yes gene_type:complete